MAGFDTVGMLCEWGKWSRNERNPLGVKSAGLIVMQLVQPASLSDSADICDEDALRVDHAVAMLKRHDLQMYKIIEFYFIKCLSMKQIEIALKLTKLQANVLFARSCGWLECELHVKSQAA